MKRKLKDSLAVKIFLLTAGLLCMVSLVTYGIISAFLPSVYRNELEENLQIVSEELQGELGQYKSVEEAKNLLELFAASNQASVTLLAPSGEIVFPEVVEDVAYEESYESDSYVTEGTAQSDFATEGIAEDEFVTEVGVQGEDGSADTVQGASGAEGIAQGGVEDYTQEATEKAAAEGNGGIIFSVEEAETGGTDVLETYVMTAQIPENENDTTSAVQTYQVTIGDNDYSLLVAGSMRAVSQTMEILKSILPALLAIIFAVSAVCAVASSLFITRPIMKLSRVSKKMAALEFDEVCPEKRSDEVGDLGRSLNELSGNLNAALTELKETNQRLRAFFAAASHELKTPVTVLKGHLGGMCQNVGAYRDREYYLQRAYEVTETMEGMVGELLSISRMEAGTWEPRKEKTDLAELVRLQMAEVLDLLEDKQMKLWVELPEHLFFGVDRSMMIKVFRNLLVNAIRYSPEGAHIRIFMKQEGREVLFWIENTGVHIPEEALSRIFDAFYRVEDSRNRKLGGSGLGLYIVRMILEQHGGVYGVENSRDGVRFWFRLAEMITE